MNNKVKLIDENKLLESLKKELEFCVKERFNEKKIRFYLGRETGLTDIIKQIESGKFTPDTTIKPGDTVVSTSNPGLGQGTVIFDPRLKQEPGMEWVLYKDVLLHENISVLEVVE